VTIVRLNQGLFRKCFGK